ncbi:MAG: hypothetical protein D6706_14450 [Chloroflexi bacterium]|nr:MAG: hypothetical protein D6706_14450 [Chloroflexota bacterium]
MGETAVFTVTLTNTGSTTLQNILLTAPQSPTCEKTISQLNTGETHTYTCSQANMTADFTHTITATSTVSGTNTPIIVTNNVFINIRPAITLTITPAPSTQPEPGGTFNFAVTIQNNSQESVFLSSLSDSLLGNLTDTGNTTLVNTNCQAGTAVSPATSYNCTYTTTFNGQPGIYTSTVTATVRDDDFSTASSTTTPTITISNTLPVLQSHLSLTPATLPASGGTITLTLHITNTSNFDTVTLTNLTEDNLGNLNGQGTCALPQTLLPTAVYTCTLTTTVTGDTDQTITYTLHITANDDDAASINANTTATLKIAPLYALFIPLINYNTVIGEPNNICEEAYPLAPNISYHFLPDDINDWYWFDLSDTGDVTVALTNFIPVDGQIVVWRGSCDNLEFIANNGNFESTKIINLGTQENGRYYIWIINDGPLNTHQPYTLQITYTPTPSVR